MDATSEREVARFFSAYVQGIGVGKHGGVAVCCADQRDDGLARAASGLRLFSIARVIEVIVAFLHTKAPFDKVRRGFQYWRVYLRCHAFFRAFTASINRRSAL